MYLWKRFWPSLKGVYGWLPVERQWGSRELVPRSIPSVLQKILNWKLKLNFDFADVWRMLKKCSLDKQGKEKPSWPSKPAHPQRDEPAKPVDATAALSFRRWVATGVRLPILVYGTGPLVCHWHHVRHPEVDAISWELLTASKWHGLGAEPSCWPERLARDSGLGLPRDGGALSRLVLGEGCYERQTGKHTLHVVG